MSNAITDTSKQRPGIFPISGGVRQGQWIPQTVNVSKKNGWRVTSLSNTLDTKTTQTPTSFQTKTVVIYESKSEKCD